MTSAATDSIGRLLSLRLRNQLLLPPSRLVPSDIVRRLGAVQAQDYGGAMWAVGLRGRHSVDADVERAFNAGEILRTHVLRPTWHFIVPEDIRWMIALTAPRVKASMAYGLRTAGLDRESLLRGALAIEKTLRGGRHLTRGELGEALLRAGLEASGQRHSYVVMYAELEALICSGPRRGKQTTYALLEERVRPAPMLNGDEALSELSFRYFASHGPATAADFAWWSGLTIRVAKRAIDINAMRLQKMVVSDEVYWHVPSSGRRVAPSAFLLPNWDEYTVAYRHRGNLVRTGVPLAAAGSRSIVFSNTVLVDGRIAGSWSRSIHGDRVEIAVARSGRWTARDRHLVDSAAQTYGAFLNRPVSVRVE